MEYGGFWANIVTSSLTFTLLHREWHRADVIWRGLVRSERTVPLSCVLQEPKDKIIYEYDFGDSWEHELLLEKVLAPDPAIRYPICVTGKRACPPEDCGGIWGYAELLEALASPNHPEHASMLEWAGDDFDPEAFDLEAVNSMLRQIR